MTFTSDLPSPPAWVLEMHRRKERKDRGRAELAARREFGLKARHAIKQARLDQEETPMNDATGSTKVDHRGKGTRHARWSVEDYEVLFRRRGEGASAQEIADELGRTCGAVNQVTVRVNRLRDGRA